MYVYIIIYYKYIINNIIKILVRDLGLIKHKNKKFPFGTA